MVNKMQKLCQEESGTSTDTLCSKCQFSAGIENIPSSTNLDSFVQLYFSCPSPTVPYHLPPPQLVLAP